MAASQTTGEHLRLHAAPPPEARALDDAVHLGTRAPLSSVATGGAPLLRCRPGRSGARALLLAPPAASACDAHRSARSRRVESGALHEGTGRQSVRRRTERGHAQPAQLRGHRSAVGGVVSLGPVRRSARGHCRIDPARSAPRHRGRRIFTGRQRRSPTGGRLRSGHTDSASRRSNDGPI